MTKNIMPIAIICAGLALMVSGCSSFDAALGKTKKSPDEFQVVVRPPLTLPPNFALRPQGEGDSGDSIAAQRVAPKKTDAVASTDELLTQSRRADASVFDEFFGTDARLAGIREIIDEETLGIQLESRIPLTVLFGGERNVGPNLNAADEALRIRKALAEGEKVNLTPTPATDPATGDSISVE